MSPPTRDKPADYHYHTYDYVGSAPFKPGPMQPDRDDYRFYSLVEDLNGLVATGKQNKVPNMRVDRVGIPTWEGRRTLVLEFGNPGRHANVPTVVLGGGIHAREWIAAEIVYLVAEYLIMHYPAGEPANRYERAIKELVNSRNIRIIPMLNPDGNDYSVFSADHEARMWRQNRRPLPKSATGWVIALTVPGGALGTPNPPFTNVRLDETGGPPRALYDVPDYDAARRVPPSRPIGYHRSRELAKDRTGVDLNRNNDTPAFGYGAPPDYDDWSPATETYWGPKKCGEAETANVRTYLTPIGNVAAAVDYHSYGEDIMYPTEADNNGVVGADYTCLGRLLQSLIRDERGVHYKLGTGELIGYDVTGAADDYMALRHQARAFTIELDPVAENPGFKLGQERIMACFEKNICGALGLLAAPARTGSLARQRASMDAALLPYGDWYVFGRGNQLPDRD